MNPIDLVAFDLDGTLAESKSPLDSEMAGLLCQLMSVKKVAVISGASFQQFEKQFLSHLGCSNEQLQNLYILPTSGAALYHFIEGWQPVYQDLFSEEESKKIMDAIDIAIRDGGYISPEKIYGQLVENRGSQITFSANGQDAPLEIKSTWDPDHAKRQAIVKVLAPLIPDFQIGMGGTNSIDITKDGKAQGITKLLEHTRISKEHMVYVGDALYPGGNDEPVMTLNIKTVPVKKVIDTKVYIRSLLV